MMGIIHFRRRREIQEAMTTFAHDEAKHSAVFRRFMAEKMRAKERVPKLPSGVASAIYRSRG
jgi:hypothetical protein